MFCLIFLNSIIKHLIIIISIIFFIRFYELLIRPYFLIIIFDSQIHTIYSFQFLVDFINYPSLYLMLDTVQPYDFPANQISGSFLRLDSILDNLYFTLF